MKSLTKSSAAAVDAILMNGHHNRSSSAVIAAGESPAQLDAAAKVLEMLDAMTDAEPPEQLAERTVERIQKLTSFDAVGAGTRAGDRVQ